MESNIVRWHALYYDCKVGQYLLYHVHTDEKRYLPEGKHTLHVSGDGNAYLHSASGTQWCDDVMEVCAFQHPSLPELWIEERSGNKMALSAFQQRHVFASVPFKLSSAAVEIDIGTYVLKQSVWGSRILFALQAWFKHLVGAFSKMSFSRWLTSWWPWWIKTLSLHSMQHEHLRKAKQLVQSSQSPLECFEEVTISLPASLALFSKWAGQSKGKSKDTTAQEAWFGGLQSLVHKFIGSSTDTHRFVFFLETSVNMRLALPLTGSNRVFCDVRGSILDLSPILLSDVLPVKHAIASSKCKLQVQMDLVTVLVELQNGGRKMLWLYNQLLHNLSDCIEVSMLQFLDSAQQSACSKDESARASDVEFLTSKAKGRAERRLLRNSKAVLWKPVLPARTRVLKYYLFYRDMMRSSDAAVQLSFDASRVGGKSILLGFCTCDGKAFWLPPQACSGTKKKIQE
eukprot:6490394-Amphidinium_carterae.1